MMTYFDMSQLSRGAEAIGRMVQEHEERVAALERDLAALLARAEAAERERDEYKIQRDLFRVSDAELTARVAELEAQLAAQGWQPVTEKPPEPPDGETSEYLTWNDLTGFTVRRYRDGQFHSAFRKQPTHWRPLPPAPDTEQSS